MIDTSRPASRILTMLEILQDHPGISGPELSERLDVSSRTIRRYIVTLQDMGIPVEPTPGRSGGYSLRPGFRLPPLMFSADEAVGLAMALLTTQVHDCALPEPVEHALAKIERVLPPELSERIAVMRSEVEFYVPEYWQNSGFPSPGVLASLAQARLARQRVWFRYGRPTGDETAREVDPYGIGIVNGRWYLHGWCHLRNAKRTFRIDRIRRVDVLPKPFDMPEGLDVIRAIQDSLALSWDEYKVELIVTAPLCDVEEFLPRHFAVLEDLQDGRVRVQASSSSLYYFASRAFALPYPMEIISPPELVELAREQAERLLAAAGSSVKAKEAQTPIA